MDIGLLKKVPGGLDQHGKAEPNFIYNSGPKGKGGVIYKTGWCASSSFVPLRRQARASSKKKGATSSALPFEDRFFSRLRYERNEGRWRSLLVAC